MNQVVIADTHVHIHRRFDLARFFRAALRNFSEVEVRTKGTEVYRLLALTEKSADNFFSSSNIPFKTESLAPTLKRIEVEPGRDIHLLAGSQIVTGEGLEILALNTVERYGDRLPFKQCIELTLNGGATVVINWCFGKWWGERGRVLRSMLDSPRLSECFVGDVPLRFSPAIDSGLMREMRQRCCGLLSGSDPLPIGIDESIAGSFGQQLRSDTPPDLRSVNGVSNLLKLLGTQGSPFGNRNTLAKFLGRQALNELSRRR